MKKVHGCPVYWESDNGNVVVAYKVFGMGAKFNVYRRTIFDAVHGGVSLCGNI